MINDSNNNNQFYTEIFLENNFLLENIQGGIVYSDFEPPFYLRYATEGMAKLSGYSINELSQMKQMDLVYEEDIPKLLREVEIQFSKGDTFEVEYRLKRKDNSIVYILDRAKVVHHDDGNSYIHCLLTDISELKEMEQALLLNQEKLLQLSMKDSLTGIYNRYAAEKFIKKQIETPNEDKVYALAILDVDFFKQVNDNNGHDFGDEVLLRLSKKVQSLLPDKSIFGRLGGDEFLIFLTLPKTNKNLEDILQTIVDGVEKEFQAYSPPITASLGAAWQTKKCSLFKDLYKNSDIALYETKNNGRNNYTIYKEKQWSK